MHVRIFFVSVEWHIQNSNDIFEVFVNNTDLTFLHKIGIKASSFSKKKLPPVGTTDCFRSMMLTQLC